MNITLNTEEKNLIHQMLEKEIFDLRTMIRHSNSYDCKRSLKHRKELLKKLKQRLAPIDEAVMTNQN